MAISKVGNIALNAAVSGSVAATMPGGLATDDVVYLVFVRRGSNGVDTGDEGLTEIVTASTGGGIGVMKVFRTVVDASPPATMTITTDGTVGVYVAGVALRGVDTTTPEDVEGATFVSAATVSNPPITLPGVTITNSGAWLMALCGLCDDSAGTPFGGIPAAFDDTVVNTESLTGNDASLLLTIDTNPSTGATGDIGLTTNSTATTRAMGVLIAAAPAAAAAGRVARPVIVNPALVRAATY